MTPETEDVIITILAIAWFFSLLSIPILFVLAGIFGGWLVHALFICILLLGISTFLTLLINDE